MKSRTLLGQTALITGAARGIGEAIALELAAHSANLVLADLVAETDAAGVLGKVRDLGRECLYVQADIGNRTQVEKLFTDALQRFQRLDILVNNAALNIRRPLIEFAVEEVEKVWAVSLWGVFHCSQLAARHMIQRGGGGNIVCISSVHASFPYARSTAYNGAKAAVNHMARTWATELAPHKVRVNVIEPGWIETPGELQFLSEEELAKEGRKLPLGRLGLPDEIARGVAYLVSPDAVYVTGSTLRIDGGYVLPR